MSIKLNELNKSNQSNQSNKIHNEILNNIYHDKIYLLNKINSMGILPHLPDELIWISHIIMGLFFIYVGYSVLVRKQLAPYISVSVVVLGALAILYHSHLWYIDGQRDRKNLKT